MQQVRVHGPNDIRIDEVAEPTPGPRDAVVRVAACGICGSDLRYVRLGGLAGPMPEPMPLGHELSGVVDSVGREVENFQPGDRVVLNPTAGGNMIGNGGREGGFTPLLLVRDAAAGASLFAVPDGLGDDVAALTEPLAVGMNAVDQSEAAAGDKVVVFGAGPIGLAAIATLADRGIDDVIAVDLSPRRLAIASELGARSTLDASEGDPWAQIRALHGEEPLMGRADGGLRRLHRSIGRRVGDPAGSSAREGACAAVGGRVARRTDSREFSARHDEAADDPGRDGISGTITTTRSICWCAVISRR